MSMLRQLWAVLFGPPYWQQIAVSRLQPGDVILYRTDEQLSAEEREVCLRYLQKEFPDHRVLVIDGGGELQIVGKAVE